MNLTLIEMNKMIIFILNDRKITESLSCFKVSLKLVNIPKKWTEVKGVLISKTNKSYCLLYLILYRSNIISV